MTLFESGTNPIYYSVCVETFTYMNHNKLIKEPYYVIP